MRCAEEFEIYHRQSPGLLHDLLVDVLGFMMHEHLSRVLEKLDFTSEYHDATWIVAVYRSFNSRLSVLINKMDERPRWKWLRGPCLSYSFVRGMTLLMENLIFFDITSCYGCLVHTAWRCVVERFIIGFLLFQKWIIVTHSRDPLVRCDTWSIISWLQRYDYQSIIILSKTVNCEMKQEEASIYSKE